MSAICKYRIFFLVAFSLISFNCVACFYENKVVFYTQPIPMMPSKVNIIDWKLIIFQMLQDVYFFNNIKSGSVLLVNIIRNNTNGNIQINKITNLLIKCISENTEKYEVICMEQLYLAYRKLGVFPENHINSYNFSVNIANYLKADYILYGIIYGDVKWPILELQLMLVKTGEILSTINADIYK